MRHRALERAPMLGSQMCTMIGRGRQSDFCSRHEERNAAHQSRWTRMKWSVKEEWGTTFLTDGMWQAIHPFDGLTGHAAGLDASDRPVGSDRVCASRGRAAPVWHDRHLAS